MNVSQLVVALEGERKARAELEEQLGAALERGKQYGETIERLRVRETALKHRLILAETAQADAAIRLGISIDDDLLRERNALEELQEKVAELESIEIMKAEVLREHARGLRSEKLALESEVLTSLGDVENEMSESVNQLITLICSSLRKDLSSLRSSVKDEIRSSHSEIASKVQQEVTTHLNTQRARCLDVFRDWASLMQVSYDHKDLETALQLSHTSDSFEKAKDRFLRTCENTRVSGLERALEEAQKAEAKAKRVALKVAQRRDQEIAEERNKTVELSHRLESALGALEEAKSNFEGVSALVETLQSSRRAQE